MMLEALFHGVAIQAKRFKRKVGIKAIQEAVAAKGYYDCSQAMVVTNSFYTLQAVKLAKANDVQLWDRNDLIKAILSLKGTLQITETVVTPQGSSNDDECVVCGKMVSEKVKQFCLLNQTRFGGNVYCTTTRRPDKKKERTD